MGGRAAKCLCGLSVALAAAALGVSPGVSPAATSSPGMGRSAAATRSRAAAMTVAGPEAHDTEVGSAPAPQPIDVVLPLAADEAGLERFAIAVTTPGSPEFGRYESIAQLARRFGASASTGHRVLRYLRRVGATAVRLDATGLFADATISAGLAERLFATRLAVFRTASAARYIAPTDAFSVPSALHGLVTGVVGLDTRPLFASPVELRRAAGVTAQAHATQQQASVAPPSGTPSGCAAAVSAGGFTPNQYLTAYGYDPLHAAGIDGQGERVALIELDGFREQDIRTFVRCFGLGLPAIRGFGVGFRKMLPAGAESTLDLELLDAAAPRLKAIDVYETHADAADTLRALTAPLQNRGLEPEVISASLGLCEPFTYEAVHRSGLIASEGALAEAVASGITFLASSGDSGSADCIFGDEPVDELAVNYPASSPWVTGVGGTNLILAPDNKIDDQPVWNDAGLDPGSAGGGGSSLLFLRPPFQTGTVSANRRAVPDVAMLADVTPGYDVYCSVPSDCINAGSSNPWQTVGGTSAGSPLLAGGFALVDEDLRLHQRDALGWVNPLLYRLGRNPTLAAQAFDDVTHIGNDVGPFIPGSGRPLGCCTAGPGYDEASGWGSVNLAGFAALALAAQRQVAMVGLSLPRGQRPIDNQHIVATVSCSGPCLMGALANVTIGRSSRFKAVSNVYELSRRGKRTVAIPFSARVLGRLRVARAHRQPVVARVVGGVVDLSGNIERESAAITLRIVL